MSKRDMSIIDSYFNSNARDLREVYGTYSNAKYMAMLNCRKLMETRNGHDLRIIGHNSSFFSVGFMTEDDSAIVYITASGSRDIALA